MQMSRPQKAGMTRRNVVLKVQTHKRLTQYLLELQNEKGNPRLTMDEAISGLLDEHTKRRS